MCAPRLGQGKRVQESKGVISLIELIAEGTALRALLEPLERATHAYRKTGATLDTDALAKERPLSAPPTPSPPSSPLTLSAPPSDEEEEEEEEVEVAKVAVVEDPNLTRLSALRGELSSLSGSLQVTPQRNPNPNPNPNPKPKPNPNPNPNPSPNPNPNPRRRRTARPRRAVLGWSAPLRTASCRHVT